MLVWVCVHVQMRVVHFRYACIYTHTYIFYIHIPIICFIYMYVYGNVTYLAAVYLDLLIKQ